MPMNENLKLRTDRLDFYKDDVQRINRLLREFLRLSSAKCAMLIDKEGHLVTKQGITRSLDMDTISALVAGSFAATKEMARLLGEDEFSALFHQGKNDNIQLSLVGDRTLLTVIFDDSTTIGMVRLYSAETAKKLAKIFVDVERRNASGELPDGEDDISEDFGDDAKTALDDILG
jgi:predicted regulator of Ras-like GTPase activity (Roadblock/LC7/MglB family)